MQVGIIESGRLGGTCVNVGCVPKKVMYSAANLVEEIQHDAGDYGIKAKVDHVDWGELVDKRDAYVKRLNGIYATNLDKSNVDTIRGHAKFIGDRKVLILVP